MISLLKSRSRAETTAKVSVFNFSVITSSYFVLIVLIRKMHGIRSRWLRIWQHVSDGISMVDREGWMEYGEYRRNTILSIFHFPSSGKLSIPSNTRHPIHLYARVVPNTPNKPSSKLKANSQAKNFKFDGSAYQRVISFIHIVYYVEFIEFIILQTNHASKQSWRVDNNIFFYVRIYLRLKSTENGSTLWCFWTLATFLKCWSGPMHSLSKYRRLSGTLPVSERVRAA